MIEPVPTPNDRPLVLAVTGTNGKTSVSTATLQLLRGIGWRAAAYDSTGISDVGGEVHKPLVRRSPEYIPQMINYQAHRGARAFSVEAFVGILAAGMLSRVTVDTAVCTGLELDHLDVHKSPEAYWSAKLSLFEKHLQPGGIAVMHVDCALGDRVEQAVCRRGARLVTVGSGGDVELGQTTEQGWQVSGRLKIHEDEFEVSVPFRDSVAVTNALLAAVAVIGAGGEPRAVAAALTHVKPPRGRLETVAQTDGVTVVVDTAHNPGALRTALHAMRLRTNNRLLLVFGAGGERDRQKRPLMGHVASELADIVILTDDNPRREPPARIRSEVRAGCPDCIEIPKRSDAIVAALQMARAGDVVLVAGKGDETEQLVATGPIPHDDREVIHRVLRSNPAS